MFSFLNKQLENLAETIAPISASTPSHRFISALSRNDEALALQCLNGPYDDNSPPMDAHAILNPTRGYQPIHLACQYGAAQVITSLLNQYGARVDTFDYQGNTALHYAAGYTGGGYGITPVDMVKMLVNDYNATVTVKNAQGQTPYDVSTDTMVRQYLLPLQLQQETQACFDNGGQGLPSGIDMGGHHMSSNIAPPPTSSMMMSNDPHAGNQQYHNTSYESNINSLMAPPPMARPVPSLSSPPNNNNNTMSMPPTSPYSPATPSVSTIPLSPGDSLSAAGGFTSTVNTPASMASPPPYNMNSMSSAPPVAVENSNPVLQNQFPPPPVSTNNSNVNNAFSEPIAKPATAVESAPPVTVSSPVLNTNMDNLTNATQAMTFDSPPTTSDVPTAPTAVSTTTPTVVSAVGTASFPSSPPQPQTQTTELQQNLQPPRPVAVAPNTNIPPRTFIKPDGFHSSASDPNLQQKYGHIKKKISIDPPPTNLMPPPPRPYASTSSLANINSSSSSSSNASSNNTSSASHIQNRYLAYNAVTGQATSLQQRFPPPPSMGGSKKAPSGGGGMGPPPISNFSVFNPGSRGPGSGPSSS